MKNLLFTLLHKLEVSYYRWKFEKFGKEASVLCNVVIEDAESSREANKLADQLRASSDVYHLACNAWLTENPRQDIGDFDALPYATKEDWMKRVAHA